MGVNYFKEKNLNFLWVRSQASCGEITVRAITDCQTKASDITGNYSKWYNRQ